LEIPLRGGGQENTKGVEAVNGVIIEYVANGWPTLEIQLGVTDPQFDKTKEVLSIWEFQDEVEMTLIIQELRAFRNQLAKETT
jgi:hypothetical protein